MSSSIKARSIKGSIWSVLDNILSQGFAFLIGIVLARLLSPSDYGTIGVLSIFLAIANVFVDCGFGNALIRKKDRSHEDLSTAFYFNVAVGLVSYLILFLLAPYIALFFNIPILTTLLRVLSFCVVFNSLSIVQYSLLTANLKIKNQAVINVCTQIPMGCIGLYFAYKGFGVWTLVIQQVGASFLKCFWLWISSRWKPALFFSKDSFNYLYNFGWKLLSANLLGTLFNEIYGFVIGRFLGTSELGYYSTSKQLSEYPRTLINNIINRVVLPVMVETQGDLDQIRVTYRKLVRLICFITFPIFGLLIIIAHPFITIIWTEKWSSTILLFQFSCIGLAFGPLSTLNFCLLQLLDRTDIMLKLEFIKKPICITILLISLPFGLKGVVLFASLYNIIGTLINLYPTNKLLNYSYIEQFIDFSRSLLICSLSVMLVLLPMQNIDNLYLNIILSIIIFVTIYCIGGFLFNHIVVKEVLSLIKKNN